MAEVPNKKTHAQRRRDEQRDALREKLRAGEYIRLLVQLAEKADTAESAAIPALRLKADIYHRLLAKCLPDLKAVELSGEIINRTASEMTEEQLEHIAAGGSAGIASAETVAEDAAPVH